MCDGAVEDSGSRDGNEADMAQALALQGELVADGVGVDLKGIVLRCGFLNAYARTEIDGVGKLSLAAVPKGGDVVSLVFGGVVAGLRGREGTGHRGEHGGPGACRLVPAAEEK